MDRHLLIDIFI